MRTNVDEWLALGPQHPLRLRRAEGQASDAGPVPYVEVRAGLEARLARPVYYELVERGEERRHGRHAALWSVEWGRVLPARSGLTVAPGVV